MTLESDDASLKVAFSSVVDACSPLSDGHVFSRRMAVTLADMFGFGPMTMVLRLERLGLVNPGSFDWFKMNGGITRAHIEQVRLEQHAPIAAAKEPTILYRGRKEAAQDWPMQPLSVPATDGTVSAQI